MANHMLQQLKRSLMEASFEVFRTRGSDIVLAERPRENLILDSGVSLRAGSPLQVRVVMRVQKGDFPHDDDSKLFERVRHLARPAVVAGFAETEAIVSRISDPGDSDRIIETFYEVAFAKDVSDLDTAIQSLRFALALEKRVAGAGD